MKRQLTNPTYTTVTGKMITSSGAIYTASGWNYYTLQVSAGEIYCISGLSSTAMLNTGYTTRGVILGAAATTSASANFICKIPYVQSGENEFYIPTGGTHLYFNIPTDETPTIKKVSYISEIGDNKLYFGKKFVTLGDSITRHNYWQPMVYKKFGMKPFNCGISGSTITDLTENTNGTAQSHVGDEFWRDVRLNLIQTLDPDILFILGGTNDQGFSCPIGTQSDIVNQTMTTFVGAYSYLIDSLWAWKPSLDIYILSTMELKDTDNTIGTHLDDYTEGSAAVAEYWNTKFIPLGNECGINKTNYASFTISDGVHPNSTVGAPRISNYIISKM